MTDPQALVEALFARPDQNEWTDADAAVVLAKAVTAVLALHKPTPTAFTGGRTLPTCDHCNTGDPYCTVSNEWPCPTVAAIIAALEEIVTGHATSNTGVLRDR